ncbi:MAG: tetratricopeptide repeat protein [Luteolibacter sp.]
MNLLASLLEPVSGYLDLGMIEDAWEELENLPPEVKTIDAVLELRILIYERLGKWELARILAESLAKKSPENPQWWIHWAYSLRREKSVSDARPVLLEAAGHHPDVALIPYNLACYQCVEGDLMGAKAFLRQAFRMDDKLKLVALADPDLEPIFASDSKCPPET